MQCDEIRSRLEAYVDGELAERERTPAGVGGDGGPGTAQRSGTTSRLEISRSARLSQCYLTHARYLFDALLHARHHIWNLRPAYPHEPVEEHLMVVAGAVWQIPPKWI